MRIRKLFRQVAIAGLAACFLLMVAPAAFSAPTVIEYWPDDAGKDVWAGPIVKDFMAANADVQIKYNKNTNMHTTSIVQVAMQSDTMPDAWFDYGGSIGGVAVEAGYSANLNDWAKAHNWAKKFNPAGLKLVTWDGVYRAVPLQVNAMGIYYNKAVFAKLGIREPKTFAELEAACAKIKAAGIIPFAIGGKGDWMTMRFQEDIIEAKCGSALHDKMVDFKASWNNPGMLAVYQTLHNWGAKEYFPQGFMGMDSSELDPLFWQGQVAMRIDGNWFQSTFATEKQDISKYGFFPFPTDQKPYRITSFAVNTMVNAHKPKANQDAATRFAEFMTDVTTLNKYVSSIGAPVATLGVKYTNATPFVQTFLGALASGSWLVTDQKLPTDFKVAFYEAQDKAITGEMTPEEAVAFIGHAADDWAAKTK
jgi:raffinose/stachyose/melibiose transport system substrate-binding protein